MCKKLMYLASFVLAVMVAPIEADTLSGLADVTVVDGAIVSLRYAETEYVVADGDLVPGTTTRWYVPVETGVATLWVEGDPAPAATVSGTSNPKEGDVGSKADNFLFTLEGSTNISSIDGIDYQETIFAVPSDTFFLFERGGNDTGTCQAILEDGSLGAEVAFDKAANGGPYADTGVGVNGQNAYGVVFTTDVPVIGVRITASGYDTLSISTPKGEEPTPEPFDPGSDGLVAHYAFENDANDSSGNGLDGTIVGDPNFVEGLVDYGMALDFDGIDDVVELGKFDVVGQITLATWIKPDDFEINDARIITKAKEWGEDDHWWMLSTISETSLRFRLKTDEGPGTATLISDPVLEAGVWAHVVVTWDGSMMRIYKDGVEVAGQEKGGSVVAVDPNVSVAIGSQPSDAFASDPSHVVKFFDGLIDEVGIYERALSEPEIRYLAGERPIPVDPGTEGLVAHYALENDANDSSGNGLDGIIVGDPAFVDGVEGMALDFNGDDYVDCGNDPLFDITGEMTVSAWLNIRSIPTAWTGAVVKGENAWRLGNVNMDPRFHFGITIWNAPDTASVDGATAVGFDEWHHATGTFDGANINVYLDGVLDGSVPTTEPIGISTTNLFIGENSESPGRSWDGLIDEVNIYNKALSVGEILYLAGFRENLLQNPSFEEDEDILDDPAWDQWVTWNPAEGAGSNATIVDTESVDGARSLMIEPVGAENWHFIVLYMPIPTEVGVSYTASFWAKAAEARPLGVQFKATDNSDSWGYADFDLTTEWAEYSLTADALNAETKLEFMCAGVEVALWLDSVSVYEAE